MIIETNSNIKDKINNYYKKFDHVIKQAKFDINLKNVLAEEWLDKLVSVFVSLKKNKQRVFFVGNGASCSMASHFAVDFTKNVGIPSFSNNEGTLLTCFSNDFSYKDAYAEMLRRYMSDGDALIAISSSGASANILQAVDFVKSNYINSSIITLSGFKESNLLRQKGTHNLYLDYMDYGLVESGHAYYLHLIVDLLIAEGI